MLGSAVENCEVDNRVGNSQVARRLARVGGNVGEWHGSVMAKILRRTGALHLKNANDQVIKELLLIEAGTLQRIAIHIECVDGGWAGSHNEELETGRAVERCRAKGANSQES